MNIYKVTHKYGSDAFYLISSAYKLNVKGTDY